MLLEGKDVIQVDATVIAGVLILMTIMSFKPPNFFRRTWWESSQAFKIDTDGWQYYHLFRFCNINSFRSSSNRKLRNGYWIHIFVLSNYWTCDNTLHSRKILWEKEALKVSLSHYLIMAELVKRFILPSKQTWECPKSILEWYLTTPPFRVASAIQERMERMERI